MSKYFVYYDTETTGTDFSSDRIVEIAAYDPVGDRVFSSLVNPLVPIPQEVINVHGITDEMVADKPSFASVGEQFIKFCGENAVLVAHNNENFDYPFLQHECARSNITLPKYELVDSLKWARKYRPDLPKHSLQFLRQVYGIEENNQHRALDDVYVLHKVFTYLIDDLDVETVINLMSCAQGGECMPFGKYQGKLLKEVPADYVKWLKQQNVFEKPDNLRLKMEFEKLGML